MGSLGPEQAVEWEVDISQQGTRLDKWIAVRIDRSRATAQKEIRDGFIIVNGHAVRPSYVLRFGDRIQRTPPPRMESDDLLAEPMDLSIVHADRGLVVVNKSAGLVVYPAAGHRQGTLLNGLKFLFPELASVTGAPLRPGVVHRLDKDTSGLMVVALTDEVYRELRTQFDARSIKRRYLALVTGSFPEDAGTLETLIGRSARDRRKMSTEVRRGKAAITKWQTLERFRGASLVEFRLSTGRTHQIRVHCASVSHPILGDRTYGGRRGLGPVRFGRQMLHAETLGFVHPLTREVLEFSVPLPEDMNKALETLRTMG